MEGKLFFFGMEGKLLEFPQATQPGARQRHQKREETVRPAGRALAVWEENSEHAHLDCIGGANF